MAVILTNEGSVLARKNVRAQDIADRLGVARPTVSTILANGGRSNTRVSQELRERVLQMAEELGYRPNAAAKAIGSGRFGCAGLVLSSTDVNRSNVPGELIFGASDALESQGMHLTIATLNDNQLTDAEFVPKILREWSCDGLLINYHTHIPARMTELIENYQVPSVWLNVKHEHDCVYFDDLQGGKTATQTLIELGHRRIAFSSHHWEGSEAHYSEHDRRDGYLLAMRNAGLKPDVSEPYSSPEPAKKPIDYWVDRLQSADRPTAVIHYSATRMASIIRAAERLGLSIPRDLSLIGFGYRPEYYGQVIDTMIQNDREFGKQAVEALLEKISKDNTKVQPRVLAVQYRPGQSVAPPPKYAR